jgi:hypothetical protein
MCKTEKMEKTKTKKEIVHIASLKEAKDKLEKLRKTNKIATQFLVINEGIYGNNNRQKEAVDYLVSQGNLLPPVRDYNFKTKEEIMSEPRYSHGVVLWVRTGE